MTVQIINTAEPNSDKNTFVILFYEGKDYHANLKKVLRNLNLEIQRLKSEEIGGHKISVFLCGDYDFLCKVFGISGKVFQNIFLSGNC